MIWEPKHPRPCLQRDGWSSLDGTWQFTLDPDAEHDRAEQVALDDEITVPFAPETELSGVGHDGYLRRVWYGRTIDLPDRGDGRWILHVGAADRETTVWADGQVVAHHVGGWTPFSADLSLVTPRGGSVELVIRCDDDPTDMSIPRGKQEWLPEPHVIWYPRATGIWQTVWLEHVPDVHVSELVWDGDPRDLSVGIDAQVAGAIPAGSTLRVILRRGNQVLTDDRVSLPDANPCRVQRRISLADGTIERPFDLIWRPSNPAIIDAEIVVEGPDGAVLDEVASYCALRRVEVVDGRLMLNDRPLFLRMALDQGFWPHSGLTAPSVEALERDVEMTRSLGLNAVRKHQKLEDPRWLAACDRRGLLVWEELPSAWVPTPATTAHLAAEWIEALQRDRNHPCIIGWVPVNESWGVPAVGHDVQQQATVRALAELAAAIAPGRIVSANDGWETVGGDVVGIHDYDQDAERVAARYADDAAVDELIAGLGPNRLPVTLDGPRAGRAVLVTEMGGVTLAPSSEGLMTYGNVTSVDDFVEQLGTLCGALNRSTALSGWCWTQLTDTWQEANGLLTAGREPKAPLDTMRSAIRSS
jgi:beta-galactosidase/beta-glucuronidase